MVHLRSAMFPFPFDDPDFHPRAVCVSDALALGADVPGPAPAALFPVSSLHGGEVRVGRFVDEAGHIWSRDAALDVLRETAASRDAMLGWDATFVPDPELAVVALINYWLAFSLLGQITYERRTLLSEAVCAYNATQVVLRSDETWLASRPGQLAAVSDVPRVAWKIAGDLAQLRAEPTSDGEFARDATAALTLLKSGTPIGELLTTAERGLPYCEPSCPLLRAFELGRAATGTAPFDSIEP